MAGDQDIIGGNDNYQSTAAANNIWWHVQRVIGVNGDASGVKKQFYSQLKPPELQEVLPGKAGSRLGIRIQGLVTLHQT